MTLAGGPALSHVDGDADRGRLSRASQPEPRVPEQLALEAQVLLNPVHDRPDGSAAGRSIGVRVHAVATECIRRATTGHTARARVAAVG